MKTTLFNTVSPEMASAFAKKLYPASMIGTMGEVYFRTRQEMDCPRGAVSFTLSDAAWISLQFFRTYFLYLHTYSYSDCRVCSTNYNRLTINSNGFTREEYTRRKLVYRSGLASLHRSTYFLGINSCAGYLLSPGFVFSREWRHTSSKSITSRMNAVV